MTLTPRSRRATTIGVVGLLALWVTAFGAAGPASAAPGDVTRVGGQGLDSACIDPSASPDRQGDDGRAPLATAQFHVSSFANVQSLAVDGGGVRVFVPDRTVIRGPNGHVAGVPPRDAPTSGSTSSTFYSQRDFGLTGAAAEGADAKKVALSPIAVAVTPHGLDLYVLERNAVRHVDLRETVPTIRTVAGQAAGTTIEVSTGSQIAADARGQVYVGDRGTGVIQKLDVGTGGLSRLATAPEGLARLSADGGGTLYVAGPGASTVYSVNPATGSTSLVAGGGAASQDGVAATSVALQVEAVAVDPTGRHLYVSDGLSKRIRKVDLSTGIINSVVGSGERTYQASGKAGSFAFGTPFALAVDVHGSVYMLIPNHCVIFMAVTPAVIFTPPPPSNPPPPQPPPSTPAGPTGQESSDTGGQGAPEPAGNTLGQAPQAGGSPQPVGGDSGAGTAQPSPEPRIVDQGSVVNSPDPVAQPTVEPAPTPAPAAQFTPTPAPAPTPVADAGTVTVGDPGASNAGAAAEPAPAVPAAPAAAPVPPTPASAPTPAAQQPVSNVGLVHGDPATPARGATRYAMVRNDEEQSVAGMAMAGAGALTAIFLCVMFVAPGASSKPKPRPKGAY